MSKSKDSAKLAVGRFAVGIDVGGTFTDLVLVDLHDKQLHRLKTPTTPEDPSLGVLTGVASLCDQRGIEVSAIDYIVHATTLVTNAIIERKGNPVGLLTTAGMRDVLEIGRESRYDLYDLYLKKPEPLVPRPLRLEVMERIRGDGAVHIKLEIGSVVEAMRQFEARKVNAVAICLLNSYLNPDHERQVAAYLQEHHPNLDLSISSDVSGEAGEYERMSTTVANAYVRPMVRGYLRRLMQELQRQGFTGQLEVMLSDGGVCSIETAIQLPVRLIESGPAAGVRAATYMSEQLGLDKVLSFDMGGTTAKIAFVDSGIPATSQFFEAARVDRARQGSGLPLQIPTIELLEIGAGGGSIASVSPLGLLEVGPESAGADPGPACYGRGGEHPTITDANLLLGSLAPEVFGFGTVSLNRDASDKAMRRLASALSLTPEETTSGVFNLVNENMTNAARLYAAERARDLRSYTMVAYGGAGPVHAYELARTLGVGRIVFPWGAGTLSAFGLLMSPRSMSVSRSRPALLEEINNADLSAFIRGLEDECFAELSTTGIGRDECSRHVTVTMRYAGQGYELQVALPEKVVDAGFPAADLRLQFERVYERVFGRMLEGLPAEIVTWSVSMMAPSATSGAEIRDATTSDRESSLAARPVYHCEADGFVETPVYSWERVKPGHRITGPAVFESEDSTVVVGPAGIVQVDALRNLVVSVSAKGHPESSRKPLGTS